jgi:hypothetical protein
MLTFNTLMKHDVRPRLRMLAALLERHRYDLVCLQEVLYRANALLIRRLARSYGYHAHTGAVLLHGGLMVLSRLPIVAARFVRYPMTAPVRPELYRCPAAGRGSCPITTRWRPIWSCPRSGTRRGRRRTPPWHTAPVRPRGPRLRGLRGVWREESEGATIADPHFAISPIENRP